MLNVTAPAGQETHTFPSSAPAAYAVGAFLRLIVGSGVYSDEVGHWFGNEAGHLFLFDSGATIPIFSRPIDQLMLPWVFEKLDRQASASITMRLLNGRHRHGRGA